MAIRFLVNDPGAGPDAPPPVRKRPLPDRRAGRAGFVFHGQEPEGDYPPGSPGFLFWQCREAALLALQAWERHAPPLRAWHGRRSRLALYPNAVRQLGQDPEPNAFYDRRGFLFFEAESGGRTTFTGASTDVVAHEVGHGVLDAFRPDLWDTPFLEVNAFHEAFGDCLAILTALHDSRSRLALLRRGLDRRNFVETFGEDLAGAVRRLDPTHNAAAPRHAWNSLRWQLPTSLPVLGGGPGALIAESHSFARVFTGCFWDFVRQLLGGARSSTALRAAAHTAGRLLLRGASEAPVEARFFRAVGRAMTLADDADGGAHHDALRVAFARHGLALGSRAMLAPVASLDGPAPRGGGAAGLADTTRRDLRQRLGAGAKARLVLNRRAIGSARVVQAVHQREIPLDAVSPRLRGVIALAPETVLVGQSGRSAAVLGSLPERATTADETVAYVASLVAHDRIDYRDPGSTAPRQQAVWSSHGIRVESGRRVLVRTRFACGG